MGMGSTLFYPLFRISSFLFRDKQYTPVFPLFEDTILLSKITNWETLQRCLSVLTFCARALILSIEFLTSIGKTVMKFKEFQNTAYYKENFQLLYFDNTKISSKENTVSGHKHSDL